MSKKGYTKLLNEVGIYQNQKSSNYLAIKKVSHRTHQKTFKELSQAKRWRRLSLDQSCLSKAKTKTATLKKVWSSMQKSHFPNLAPSTCAI